MGEAREVFDRATDALFKERDLKKLSTFYSPDVIAETPDQGEIKGAEQVVDWFKQFLDGFPEARYERVHAHESGNTAIDEGIFSGKNTGPILLPTGDSMPATGKDVWIRGCDFVTVENGKIVSHRFYYDQVEFLTQLGIMPEMG
jgi:ketosteroid isomerase-like protein